MRQELFTIVDDITVTFNLDSLASQLRLRSSAKNEKRLGELAAEAAPIARPKAGARLSAINSIESEQVVLDEITFSSPLLVEKFNGLGRVFPYLATEGEELAEWGRSFAGLDRVLADALQQDALQQARLALEGRILETYGLVQVSALNPGSLLVWPIRQQVPLFELLTPLPEKLGISLLPSFMMKPERSVSGIFFQSDTKFHNCQLCPKVACPNRKAPSQVAQP